MTQKDMIDHISRYTRGEESGYSVSFDDANYGGEWAQEILIKAGSWELFRGIDKCEPEDALFCRHFDWIEEQLLMAYQLGKVHALIDYAQEINKR